MLALLLEESLLFIAVTAVDIGVVGTSKILKVRTGNAKKNKNKKQEEIKTLPTAKSKM